MVDPVFALQTKVIDTYAKVLVYTLPTLQHVGICRICGKLQWDRNGMESGNDSQKIP